MSLPLVHVTFYIYMSTAICKYHTDQCTMYKYGGKLSLIIIAGQHVATQPVYLIRNIQYTYILIQK